MLASVFDTIPAGSVLFFDEIDAIALNRAQKDLHEVSRKLVSVLLKKLDSMESGKQVTVVMATNRKSDLDPSVLSRISSFIRFELPSEKSRR